MAVTPAFRHALRPRLKTVHARRWLPLLRRPTALKELLLPSLLPLLMMLMMTLMTAAFAAALPLPLPPLLPRLPLPVLLLRSL